MCGIAGFISGDQTRHTPDYDQMVLQSLYHRGPDDRGVLYYDGQALTVAREPCAIANVSLRLYHTRLSILDLSKAGHQPMISADQRYALTFNGEIYNYVELRRELEKMGHVFRSETDTEVLLHAYSQWGSAMLTRLVGMFAFVIFDRARNELFCARDFFGIKPFYYTQGPRGFSFASEIKTLLLDPNLSRSVNPQRVLDFLRLGATDHGEETLLAAVATLPAAHYLRVSLATGQITENKRYWAPDLEATYQGGFEDAADECKNLFLQNIGLHQRADVPLGVALSGGIDSSAIVSAVRHLHPHQELHTFSFIAKDDPKNEEHWIDIVTQAKNCVSHKIILSADQLQEDVDDLIKTHDTPFASTSIYAQYQVFKHVAQTPIKVMLDGQGADEIFAGYHIYIVARIMSLCRRGRIVQAWQLLQNAADLPGLSIKSILLQSGQFLVPNGLQSTARHLAGRSILAPWFDKTWFCDKTSDVRLRKRRFGRDSLKDALCYSLLQRGLLQLLRYEDRDSMRFSIESRVPFLTPKFVQFALSLPESYLINQQAQTKSVFRHAMRDLLPELINQRRDKIGFATPEVRWMQQLDPWINELLHDSSSQDCHALDPKQVLHLYQQVKAGQHQHSSALWRCLCLLRWSDLYRVSYG